MSNIYSRFYSLIKQINEAGGNTSKEEVVSDFTCGETTSLKALTLPQFQELERRLIALVNKSKSAADYDKDPRNATRKAIISHFFSIGRDVQAAKNWCEKYGVNGQKRKFNDYTNEELFLLLQNAKKVKRDYIISANKKLTNGKGV